MIIKTIDMSVQKDIEQIAKSVRSVASQDALTLLPPDFEPGKLDVICARGKRAYNHIGNRRFRALIEAHLDTYQKASTKMEKTLIVTNIVDSIREASPNGGFVREENGRWFEVGDHNAREKIGQCFRDLLHFKYKSSTKAKKARRKNRQSFPEDGSSASTALPHSDSAGKALPDFDDFVKTTAGSSVDFGLRGNSAHQGGRTSSFVPAIPQVYGEANLSVNPNNSTASSLGVSSPGHSLNQLTMSEAFPFPFPLPQVGLGSNLQPAPVNRFRVAHDLLDFRDSSFISRSDEPASSLISSLPHSGTRYAAPNTANALAGHLSVAEWTQSSNMVNASLLSRSILDFPLEPPSRAEPNAKQDAKRGDSDVGGDGEAYYR